MNPEVKDLQATELQDCRVFLVRSAGGNATYSVLFWNGKWSCGCPASIACKHIARAQLLLGRKDICLGCGKQLYDELELEDRRHADCLERWLLSQMAGKLSPANAIPKENFDQESQTPKAVSQK
jgi:hypothetical protein